MRGPLRWWIGAVAALVLVGLAVRLVPDTPAESDHAVTEILVLNVLHAQQAVGAYSRFGWNHPGPLYLQLLAPLYWLSGYRHLSVILTVAILNAGCLIALLAIVRRFGTGPGIFASAIVVLGVFLARMDGLLASSWNPHVGILPMALLVVCAAAAPDAPWLLAWVIALASFVIQAHVGSALAAVVIAAAATAMVAIDALTGARDRRRPRTSLIRTLGIAAGVGALLWALPLADALRPAGSHNLQQIYAFFRTHSPVSPRAADRAFERFFVAPFTPNLHLWSETPPEVRYPAVHPLAIVEGALLAASAVIWAMRRRRFEMRLAIVSIVGLLAALVAIRRLPEYPMDYTILWLSAIGVMAWTTILALPADVITSWIVRKAPGARIAFDLRLPAVAAGAILIASAWQVSARYADEARTASPIRELSAIVQTRLDEAPATSALVHMPETGWGTVAGVILQLYRAGDTLHVDADWVSMFGVPFAPTGHEPVAIVLADQAEQITALQYRSDIRHLGRAGQTHVYSLEPTPATAPLPPLSIAGNAEIVGDPARLTDGRVSANDDATVTFAGAGSFVTLSLPRGAVLALRISGESTTAWDVSCSDDNARFVAAGRIAIPSGAGVQQTDAFLRALASCSFVRISPVGRSEAQWLSEIQPLGAGAPR